MTTKILCLGGEALWRLVGSAPTKNKVTGDGGSMGVTLPLVTCVYFTLDMSPVLSNSLSLTLFVSPGTPSGQLKCGWMNTSSTIMWPFALERPFGK